MLMYRARKRTVPDPVQAERACASKAGSGRIVAVEPGRSGNLETVEEANLGEEVTVELEERG
jgi:hypothetical protein